MCKVMQGKGYDVTKLDTFSATLAHWRYETVPHAGGAPPFEGAVLAHTPGVVPQRAGQGVPQRRVRQFRTTIGGVGWSLHTIVASRVVKHPDDGAWSVSARSTYSSAE